MINQRYNFDNSEKFVMVWDMGKRQKQNPGVITIENNDNNFISFHNAQAISEHRTRKRVHYPQYICSNKYNKSMTHKYTGLKKGRN